MKHPLSEESGDGVTEFVADIAGNVAQHKGYNIKTKILNTTTAWRKRPMLLPNRELFLSGTEGRVFTPKPMQSTEQPQESQPQQTQGGSILTPPPRIGHVYYDQARFIREDHPAYRPTPNKVWTWKAVGNWQ